MGLTEFSTPFVQLSPGYVDKLWKNLPEFACPWVEDRAPAPGNWQFGELGVRIRNTLDANEGLAILVGQGLAELSDGQLACLHYRLASQLGRPICQDASRELLVEVSPSEARDKEAQRGYLTDERMLLHSDAADFAGLMCLCASKVGGTSLFASVSAVHDALKASDPDLLAELYREWDWNTAALGLPLVSGPMRAPVFDAAGDRIHCRYSSSLLRDGAAAAGRELDRRQRRALDAFEAAAVQPGHVFRHRLERGESVWMNNNLLLHGREAFAQTEGGARRRLLRAWVRAIDESGFSPRFRRFDSQMFAGTDVPCLPEGSVARSGNAAASFFRVGQ